MMSFWVNFFKILTSFYWRSSHLWHKFDSLTRDWDQVNWNSFKKLENGTFVRLIECLEMFWVVFRRFRRMVIFLFRLWRISCNPSNKQFMYWISRVSVLLLELQEMFHYIWKLSFAFRLQTSRKLGKRLVQTNVLSCQKLDSKRGLWFMRRIYWTNRKVNFTFPRA